MNRGVVVEVAGPTVEQFVDERWPDRSGPPFPHGGARLAPAVFVTGLHVDPGATGAGGLVLEVSLVRLDQGDGAIAMARDALAALERVDPRLAQADQLNVRIEEIRQ